MYSGASKANIAPCAALPLPPNAEVAPVSALYVVANWDAVAFRNALTWTNSMSLSLTLAVVAAAAVNIVQSEAARLAVLPKASGDV